MCCCCQKEPIQFAIGDGRVLTPVEGANVYNNTDIKYSKYLILRNGKGYMFEDSDYTRLCAGGIQLIGSDFFDADEKFTFTFYN